MDRKPGVFQLPMRPAKLFGLAIAFSFGVMFWGAVVYAIIA